MRPKSKVYLLPTVEAGGVLELAPSDIGLGNDEPPYNRLLIANRSRAAIVVLVNDDSDRELLVESGSIRFEDSFTFRRLKIINLESDTTIESGKLRLEVARK